MREKKAGSLVRLDEVKMNILRSGKAAVPQLMVVGC